LARIYLKAVAIANTPPACQPHPFAVKAQAERANFVDHPMSWPHGAAASA